MEAFKETTKRNPEATIKNAKNNTKRNRLFSVILGIIIVCLSAYFAYGFGTNSSIETSAPILSNPIEDTEALVSSSFSRNDSPSCSLSEYDEETDKTISNVPKPQKTLKPSSLPFNPAGCPYVFVRGDDRSAMSANKSIVSLRRSTYFAIETISPGSVRFVQIRLRFGTSCLKYYIFVTILR